jgi:hypothetical protein
MHLGLNDLLNRRSRPPRLLWSVHSQNLVRSWLWLDAGIVSGVEVLRVRRNHLKSGWHTACMGSERLQLIDESGLRPWATSSIDLL